MDPLHHGSCRGGQHQLQLPRSRTTSSSHPPARSRPEARVIIRVWSFSQRLNNSQRQKRSYGSLICGPRSQFLTTVPSPDIIPLQPVPFGLHGMVPSRILPPSLAPPSPLAPSTPLDPPSLLVPFNSSALPYPLAPSSSLAPPRTSLTSPCEADSPAAPSPGP